MENAILSMHEYEVFAIWHKPRARIVVPFKGQTLDKILNRVRQCMENQGGEIDSTMAESWYPGLGSIQARCEASLMLWFHYANQDESGGIPQARWLSFNKIQINKIRALQERI